ncbi:SDR family NAD(P)-dependent oxidoreductase [Saccharothrix coeruleofusca]|uniref:Short-chain type dehydrogenase/reductase n=1 Tax=Saccharothrix coeruleofusca TaxID=33919 RepID=A0A918AV39_9PSEU|nr:SDR family oxidoreductase [Saccharothrix coeruleofusca]MBP2335857.1 NAD(P)-dependent dehydrogenase (short-subunit alcohol dehydrogenase family) [Saccharothrix coeruleofusca]GGP87438.1 putative short-chain type dehydrogenase/reductase [Saccharothrix coeruleofusca]
MGRLAGKVAIATGAAGGLGLAGVRAMAAQGAHVVMMDVSSAVRERARELAAEGFEVVPYTGDVSVEEDVAGVVELAQRSYGRLDVLWNNAALLSPEWMLQDTDVLHVSRDHLMRTLEVNVGGVFLGSKHAVPVMAASGGGSIINTSSVQAAGGDLTLVSYGTSKAAIEHLTRSVATSYGHLGIRCNAVVPGLIAPPSSPAAAERPHRLEDIAPARLIRDSQMLDLPGDQADVANTVVFLASDESKFITGQLIRVDGGVTGHLPTLADRRRLAGAAPTPLKAGLG